MSLVTDNGPGVKQAEPRTPPQLLALLRQSGWKNREQTGGESEGKRRGHHLLVTSSKTVSCSQVFTDEHLVLVGLLKMYSGM